MEYSSPFDFWAERITTRDESENSHEDGAYFSLRERGRNSERLRLHGPLSAHLPSPSPLPSPPPLRGHRARFHRATKITAVSGKRGASRVASGKNNNNNVFRRRGDCNCFVGAVLLHFFFIFAPIEQTNSDKRSVGLKPFCNNFGPWSTSVPRAALIETNEAPRDTGTENGAKRNDDSFKRRLIPSNDETARWSGPRA